MVESIFSTITSAVSALGEALATAGTSVAALFWQAPAQGETGVGNPTFLGTLIFIGLAGGIIALIVRMIKGSMHRVA